MPDKLVSIILSVYNGEQYLEDCIRSVLNQTYEAFEFIIINDGSKDASLSIVQRIEAIDNRIITIDKENSGLTKSLNIGLKKATGEYITRIDADDLWAKNKLEIQVAFMEANKDVMLSGTTIDFIDGKNQSVENQKPLLALKNDEIRKVYLFQNPFCHSSVIFRSKIIEKIGPYNPEFKFAQDYEYWHRIMKLGKVEVIPETLVSRRVTEDMIGIKRSRNQRYFGLKTKLKVFANSKPTLKGIRHLVKIFAASIVPSTLAKNIRNIIRS